MTIPVDHASENGCCAEGALFGLADQEMDDRSPIWIQLGSDPQTSEACPSIISAIQRVTDNFTLRCFAAITLATTIGIGVARIGTKAILTECCQLITISITACITTILGIEPILLFPSIGYAIAIAIYACFDSEAPLCFTDDLTFDRGNIHLVGANILRVIRLFAISRNLIGSRGCGKEATVDAIILTTITTIPIITQDEGELTGRARDTGSHGCANNRLAIAYEGGLDGYTHTL